MVSKITLSLKKRAASERGISTSELFNDLVNEVSHDLINITRQWNSIAYPIFSSLPQGELDTRWDLDSTLNPVVNGLDGTQVFMDNDAAEITDDGRFFNTTLQRPLTLKEVSNNIQVQIDEINEAVQLIEVLGGEGLTEEQKGKIGLNIFNPFQASASDSIDGRSRRNEFNVTQIAKDFYGPAFTLDGDGDPNLANNLRDMVDALLEMHTGDWDTDIALQHQIVDADVLAAAGILQTKIDHSASYVTLNRVGIVDHLEDDLNRIRYELGALRGNNVWDTDFSGIPYAGAPVSLQGHAASVGTGVSSATNPHGLAAADIGLSTPLAAIVAFTGMDNTTDTTPDYANNNFINTNDPLETAIGKLDAQLKLTDDENDAHRAITNGNPHGVDMDDFVANTVIDRINLASNWISADRIMDGVLNIIPTLAQEAAWDNHLIDLSNAHVADAISVNESSFTNISGTDAQTVFESIDQTFTDNRLEVAFARGITEVNDPIIVTHNKGKYPIVQLVDTSTQVPYQYQSIQQAVSQEEGLAIFINIEHVSINQFRVWTNSTDGVIIAIF